MARNLSPKEAKAKRKQKAQGEGGRIITTGQGVGPGHNHERVLEADGSINISQSKAKAWLQCRRMYHNRYFLGLQKKKVKRPFMFGRIVHEILEADLKGKDWTKVLKKIDLDNTKLFKREIEMYGNIIEDIHDIMLDYFDFWGKEAKPVKGPDDELAEHEFRVELYPDIWFTGRIDAILKAKKMLWLGEHKTFARMPSEDERWRNVQSSVYFRALQIVGFKPIDGVLWDYVSSKVPMFPEQKLASGKFSQARLNTIPARLDRWIKTEGLKKADYTKLRDEAMENRRNWFIRVYSPVKPQIVDMIWDNFLETAREIAEQHGKKTQQNIGRHCSWCDFAPLCKAELTGNDVEWLIQREYTTEDQRGEDRED